MGEKNDGEMYTHTKWEYEKGDCRGDWRRLKDDPFSCASLKGVIYATIPFIF